jgi:autotransporter-associated beta strand protein
LSSATGNSYSGPTIINSGTLNANNTTGSATGSGPITVAGGTLGGTGSVAGDVTLNGGSIGAGMSVGALDVGGLTFNAGSSLEAELDSSAAAAMGADLLNSSGGLSIADGATLELSDVASTSTLLPANTKFTLVRYDAMAGWNGVSFANVPDGLGFGVGMNFFIVNYADSTGGLNFGGGTASSGQFVTITATGQAVPEASAFLFGGLACAGVGAGRLWVRRRGHAKQAG